MWLHTISYISLQNDVIAPDKFTFEDFLRFYKHLCGRNEVDKIFHEL